MSVLSTQTITGVRTTCRR